MLGVSTRVLVRIDAADEDAGYTVRDALIRHFPPVEDKAETVVGPYDSAGCLHPEHWFFTVDTARRHHPHGPAELGPPGSGPAIVELYGGDEQVPEVAEVFVGDFVTVVTVGGAPPAVADMTLVIDPATRP
jgi:hypothetical protein